MTAAALLLADVIVSVEGAVVVARAPFDDVGLERRPRALCYAV